MVDSKKMKTECPSKILLDSSFFVLLNSGYRSDKLAAFVIRLGELRLGCKTSLRKNFFYVLLEPQCLFLNDLN